jgi:hypothetical protein
MQQVNTRSIFSSSLETETIHAECAPAGKNMCAFKSAICMIAHGAWKETLAVGN